MIDIHTHLIPGIDDGSPDLEASLVMAEQAADSGTTMMAVTPHANQRGRFENYFGKSLFRRFQALKDAIQEEEIPLKIYLGMEIYASDDMGEKIRQRKLIGINASRYYLVEFDFHEEEAEIRRYLSIMKAAGAVPLIAHAERYDCVKEDPQIVTSWKKQGALIQINQGSVLGHFGPRAACAVEELLDLNLVTCVSSDAHDPRRRTAKMDEVQQLLRASYGEERARELFVVNPKRILANKEFPRGN